MAKRTAFGELCSQVCEQQGWSLLPSGVDVALGDGRHQLVRLEHFEHEGREIVRLYSVIGEAEPIDPVRLLTVLRINFHLAHGALALKDEELVMIDTLLLKDAGAREIEASISYLAETADYYEKSLFGIDKN